MISSDDVGCRIGRMILFLPNPTKRDKGQEARGARRREHSDAVDGINLQCDERSQGRYGKTWRQTQEIPRRYNSVGQGTLDGWPPVLHNTIEELLPLSIGAGANGSPLRSIPMGCVCRVCGVGVLCKG